MPVDEAKRRAYQDRTTDAAADALRDRKDVLIISPTGSGKTAIALEVLKLLQFDTESRDFRTLVVQDRLTVAEQNKMAADKTQLTGNVLWTQGRNAERGRTTFATIDTALKTTSDLTQLNLLLIDEVHHASAGARSDQGTTTEYTRLIDRLSSLNPGLLIMGMSATEERADGEQLHSRLLTAQKIRVTHHEAMEAGAIVPVRTFVPEQRLTISGHPTVHDAVQPYLKADPERRDAGIQALLQRHRRPDFLEYVVDQTLRQANGEPAFAYVSRTADADSLAAAFRAEGVAARSVHYRHAAADNRRALIDFEAGGLDVLVSVDMLSEGVNLTRTAAVINAKEITTVPDQQQMVGRAMRAHTTAGPDGVQRHKSHAVHVDLGATSFVHGTPETRQAIETLGYHGRDVAQRTLWKEVGERPRIVAMPLGLVTMFGVEQPDEPDPARRWALFVKDEGSARSARATATLRRAPTPWADAEGMESFERDQARAHPRRYVRAESEEAETGRFGLVTGATRLQEAAEASYRASRDALKILSEHGRQARATNGPSGERVEARKRRDRTDTGFGW